MGDVTELLRAANSGDKSAAHRLFSVMYDELKRLARSSLRKNSSSAQLDTTMLVHETFLRLAEREHLTPPDRLAFYSYIGKVMRSVVLDTVRENRAQKRGGDQLIIALTTGVGEPVLNEGQLLAVDDALGALGNLASELRDLVELRYFAGLTVAEVSELTGKPLRSVERDWTKARMLLRQLMREG